MQIKIRLKSNKNINLPIHYNSILQGFMYHNIGDELADFLHNKGYIYNDRSFKLFTFSRILNYGKIKNNSFHFGKSIEFIISSPIEEFCIQLVNNLMTSDSLRLGRNELQFDNMEMIDSDGENKEEIIVDTLSNIVIYSTIDKEDGRKYTVYYKAEDEEFNELIGNNMIKKYKAYYNKELENKDFTIEPIGETKQNIVYFRKILIKGITGKFRIKGNPELLQLAIDAGIGGKNSQGFGCLSLVE